MQTIITFIKGTLEFLIGLWIITLLMKYFLKRTLLGKIINLFCHSIWTTLIFTYRHTKKLGKIAYTDTRKYCKYIDEQCKKFSSKKQEQKVVNDSDNVVDFKTAKKQYNKKHE